MTEVSRDKLKEFVEECLRGVVDGHAPNSEFGVGYVMCVMDLAWTLQCDERLSLEASEALGFRRSDVKFDPNRNPFLPKEVRNA